MITKRHVSRTSKRVVQARRSFLRNTFGHNGLSLKLLDQLCDGVKWPPYDWRKGTFTNVLFIIDFKMKERKEKERERENDKILLHLFKKD